MPSGRERLARRSGHHEGRLASVIAEQASGADRRLAFARRGSSPPTLGSQTPGRDEVKYELDEHRHRFSVWAAARATQRGLCDVVTLREALENCGVVAFLRGADLDAIGPSEFDKRPTAPSGTR